MKDDLGQRQKTGLLQYGSMHTALNDSLLLHSLINANSAHIVFPLLVGVPMKMFSSEVYNAWNTWVWILLNVCIELA